MLELLEYPAIVGVQKADTVAILLSRWARVCAGIVGATLAAFATSSPELAVAVSSALAGSPEVALGDALGSNIFNCLFIVGTVGSIQPIVAGWGEVAVTVLFGVAATAASVPARNGVIARRRGSLLLTLYAAYLTLLMAGD